MSKLLILCSVMLFAAGAMADKKPATELKWGSEDEDGCRGKICFNAKQHQRSEMDQKIDKADRMRLTDPFSAHNSDDGNDQKSAEVTFNLD